MARKNPAAVALGKRGGRASAKSRLAAMTDEDRTAIGKRMVEARWAKYRKEHPEKAKASESRRKKRAEKKAGK